MQFVNDIKLARARKVLKEEGVLNPTQEQLRSKYVLFGGLVVEDNELEEEVVATKNKKSK
jgi:hypothetical protein